MGSGTGPGGTALPTAAAEAGAGWLVWASGR